LGDVIGLLRRHGERFWAQWLQQCLVGLNNFDAHALEKLVKAYGGMGSFNDLVLGELGPDGWADEDMAANDQLELLRQRCYSLAQDLRRELRRP
jgi:hypothetical protein